MKRCFRSVPVVFTTRFYIVSTRPIEFARLLGFAGRTGSARCQQAPPAKGGQAMRQVAWVRYGIQRGAQDTGA